MFLDEFGDCIKSQLYGTVSRTSYMPRRLDAMEAAGLIVQTGYRGSNVRALVHSGTPSVFTFCSVLFLFRVFGVEDRLLRLNLGAEGFLIGHVCEVLGREQTVAVVLNTHQFLVVGPEEQRRFGRRCPQILWKHLVECPFKGFLGWVLRRFQIRVSRSPPHEGSRLRREGEVRDP